MARMTGRKIPFAIVFLLRDEFICTYQIRVHPAACPNTPITRLDSSTVGGRDRRLWPIHGRSVRRLALLHGNDSVLAVIYLIDIIATCS